MSPSICLRFHPRLIFSSLFPAIFLSKTSYRLFIYLLIVVCFKILLLMAEWSVNYELENMSKEATVVDFKVLSQDLSVCAEVRNVNCLVRNSNCHNPRRLHHLAQWWHFELWITCCVPQVYPIASIIYFRMKIHKHT